jgi:hypothetical protein
MVQMSHEWIFENIRSAVADDVADEIRLNRQRCYSRHLFFSPLYHPCALKHAESLLTRASEAEHRDHEAFHYTEVQVKAAVNKRKAAMRRRHGNLQTLAHES